MKKAKIMLTVITLLAIVGGALAFKAKGFAFNYCTSIASGIVQNRTCPNFTPTQKVKLTGTRFYYTLAVNSGDCNDASGKPLKCAISTTIGNE